MRTAELLWSGEAALTRRAGQGTIPPAMNLLIATRNRHKLKEIRAILSLPEIDLLDVDDVGRTLPEVVEDGDTFQANAVKKAVELALASGLWTLADDSGLEVDALGGAPGVYSARYAGEPADYDANNRKLLAALRGVSDRRARFRCVIALSSPSGEWDTVEGACEGRIATDPRGREGFGYDPVFVPEGREQTFAEMPPAEKDRISHRAAALGRAREAWGGKLAGLGDRRG